MSSKWMTPSVKQTWVSSPTLLNKVGSGMMHGTMSCLQAAMKAPDSTFKMDLHTATWFVASLEMSALIGRLLVSILMDKFGRRTAFLTLTIPGVIGAIIIGSASNIPIMFLGRILCGICVGSTSCLGAVIIAEYTCPENRGMLLNMKTACLNVGSLICIILGHFCHWRTVAIVSSTPFVVSLLITYTWPESPFWLAEKKKFRKSEEVFYWLRGKSEDSTRELKELLRSQRDNKEITFAEKFVEIVTKFKKKNFQKPAFIVVISNLLLEVSGRHIFPSYAVVLVEEITLGNFDSFYYSIVINVLIIISGIMSAILIKTIGVRKLLFTTGTATVIVLLLACMLLYLVSSGVISNSYAWLPLFSYAAFFFLSNLGCTSIPLALAGELFPLEHRAFGSTIISGYSITIFASVALKCLPYMIRQFMMYGTFAILGVLMVICLIILYFMLPETKNRTLQEIEYYFKYGKFREGDVVTYYEDDVEKENEKSSPLLMPNRRHSLRGVN